MCRAPARKGLLCLAILWQGSGDARVLCCTGQVSGDGTRHWKDSQSSSGLPLPSAFTGGETKSCLRL